MINISAQFAKPTRFDPVSASIHASSCNLTCGVEHCAPTREQGALEVPGPLRGHDERGGEDDEEQHRRQRQHFEEKKGG